MQDSLTYKNKGFHSFEAWYGGKFIARISSTYGKQAEMGQYRVQFLDTGLDAYVSTIKQTKELVDTHIQDMTYGKD
tara:strand:- start:2168 stop:2395 length:228 start_codon:yes stop_codon:yes gene_type:complete